MNHSPISINDLPDEIILMIWNKLNNIDVLYSFVGVNQRLDNLVRDPIYTRSIQLTETITNKYCSLSDSIIDQYYLNILPEIHQHIECFTLEPSSMERILISNSYPRLHKLTFTKITEDFVVRHFTGNISFDILPMKTSMYMSQEKLKSRKILNFPGFEFLLQHIYSFLDESPLINIFKHNIKHLIMTIDRNEFTSLSPIDLGKNLFTRILNIFLNLIDLDLHQNRIENCVVISVNELPSTLCYSSSLVNLSICVKTFDDCLCLLDGRLFQLQNLSIIIKKIENPTLTTENLVSP
jgi:hypothetical protein